MSKKKKISISIGTLQELYGDMKALEIAKEIGADAVDFDLYSMDYRKEDGVYSKNDSEMTDYYTAIYRKALELGIEIGQTHGRMRTFMNDPVEDAAIIENARRDCLATAALHAKHCVMHSVTTGIMGPDADPALMHDICYRVFQSILPYAKKYDVQVVTETFGDSPKYQCCDFFGSLKEFKAIYERICAEGDNAEYFKVCIDTGHSNKAMRFQNPTPAEFIRAMGSSIVCLHLNDNDTLTDQHKIPMTGTIDWEAVFDALDEIGYEGSYNMELNLEHFGEGFEIETAAFAVKVMRHMLDMRYGKAGT